MSTSKSSWSVSYLPFKYHLQPSPLIFPQAFRVSAGFISPLKFSEAVSFAWRVLPILFHLATSTSSFRTQMRSLSLKSILSSNADAPASVLPEYTETFLGFFFINFHASTAVTVVPGYSRLSRKIWRLTEFLGTICLYQTLNDDSLSVSWSFNWEVERPYFQEAN